MLEDISRLFLNVKEKIKPIFVSDKKSFLDLEIEFNMRLIEYCIQNYDIISPNSDDQNKIIMNFKQILQYLGQNSADTKYDNESLLEIKENIKLLLNYIVDIMLTFIKEQPKGFFDNLENKNSEEPKITKVAYGRIDKIEKNLVSLDEKIKNINNEISKNFKECQEKYGEISQNIQATGKAFVKLSQTSGILEGKVNEIDTKMKNKWSELEDFKNEINALTNQGKEMLGITTIASLAKSYKETRESYDNEVKNWQYVFLGSIAIMVLLIVISMFISIDSELKVSWSLNVRAESYLSILNSFLLRLSFCLPLVWLAIFASNRRNEAKRLRGEYEHKETLANVYYGYKEQIKELKDEKAQELAAKLMQNLVEMTNENPNRALDKIKTENIPTIESIEKFLKLAKDFQNLFGKNK